MEELVGGQNPGPEAPSRSKKDKRGRRKGYVRKGAMDKGWYIRIIEGGEVRRNDLIEYFFPTGVVSTS